MFFSPLLLPYLARLFAISPVALPPAPSGCPSQRVVRNRQEKRCVRWYCQGRSAESTKCVSRLGGEERGKCSVQTVGVLTVDGVGSEADC